MEHLLSRCLCNSNLSLSLQEYWGSMERMEREREERKEIIEQASTYLVNLCYVDLLFFSS